MTVFLYSLIVFLALVVGAVPTMCIFWAIEAAWQRKYEKEQFSRLKGGR